MNQLNINNFRTSGNFQGFREFTSKYHSKQPKLGKIHHILSLSALSPENLGLRTKHYNLQFVWLLEVSTHPCNNHEQ